MKKTFYLIAGANGSGKTTLGHELLAEEKELVFLNTDEVAEKIGDKVGLRSGQIILQYLDKTLAAGKSVVWESTISGNHHTRIMERFRKAGYEIVFIYVFLESPEHNLARIKQRVALGGHDVPKEDVLRRFKRSIANFWEVINLADQWRLYYNGETSYELIAKNNKDNIEIFNDDVFGKFKGLKNG